MPAIASMGTLIAGMTRSYRQHGLIDCSVCCRVGTAFVPTIPSTGSHRVCTNLMVERADVA